MCRVYFQALRRKKGPVDDIDQRKMQVYLRRLAYLESVGCQWYDIAEDLSVLWLSQGAVDERKEWLSTYRYPHISIPVLGLVTPASPADITQRRVDRYLCRMLPDVSVAGAMKTALSCGEDDLVLLLYNNPKMAYWVYMNAYIAKIKLLREHGASMDKIGKESYYLTFASLKKLQSKLAGVDISTVPLRNVTATGLTWSGNADEAQGQGHVQVEAINDMRQKPIEERSDTFLLSSSTQRQQQAKFLVKVSAQ